MMKNILIRYFFITICLSSIIQSASAEITEEQKQFLLHKFAPMVHLHPKEAYFPASVPWFLERTDLRKGNPKNNELISENPTIEELTKYPNESDGYFLAIKGNSSQKKETAKGEPLVNGESRAPCYAHIVEKDGGIVIQYMFFFAYNGAFNIMGMLTSLQQGIHEGDWEHVDVYLLGKDENAKLDEIYYAAHGATHYGEYKNASQIKMEEDHPVVYSSFHGHGSYYNTFSINHAFDRTGSGAPWRCWQNVIDLGEANQPTPGNEWLLFGGRWGGVGGGPGTPTRGGWWRSNEIESEQIYNEPLFFDRKNKIWKSKQFSFSERSLTRHKKFHWKIEDPSAAQMTFTVEVQRTFTNFLTNFWKSMPKYGPYRGDGVTTDVFNKSETLQIIVRPEFTPEEKDLRMIIDGITK